MRDITPACVEMIVAFTLGILAGSIFSRFIFFRLKRGNKSLMHLIETDLRIGTEVQYLQENLAAAYVSVLQFHNGTRYMSGTGIERMSQTHRAAPPNNMHKLWPSGRTTSLYADLLAYLHPHDTNHMQIVRTISLPNAVTRQELLAENIMHFVVAPITYRTRCVGLVFVGFSSAPELPLATIQTHIKTVVGHLESCVVLKRGVASSCLEPVAA